MSNYNGAIIYIDTSTDPNIGVSIADAQTVLETSANTEGELCKHDNINKWSKYKPERHNTPLPVSYSTRKANNFGLEVPFCNEYGANVMNFMVYDFVYNYGEEGWKDIWNYLKPRGSYSENIREFYRLSDFARIPSDTTDPNYGSSLMATRGYNKNARMPFNVSMDKAGTKFYYDNNRDIWVYDINTQVTNKLNFVFFNSVGDDLHLQDFVDIPSTVGEIDDSTIAWRPVVQVFNDYKGAYDDYWYERRSAQYEIAGDAITSDESSICQVEIDLEDSNFELNQYYHVCAGVGKCKKDPTSPNAWASGTDALFLPPYLREEAESFVFPFYFVIRPVSYNARRLNVTALQFYADGIVRWENAGGTAPYFTIHSLATGRIGLTMNITKVNGQAVDFVSQNGSTQTAGASPLRIQAREMITGVSGETTLWLTPSSGPSNWSNTQYIPVPAGDPEETVQLYATLNIGSIPVGGYGEYHLYATTNDSDYVNIGYFSIQKIQYT